MPRVQKKHPMSKPGLSDSEYIALLERFHFHSIEMMGRSVPVGHREASEAYAHFMLSWARLGLIISVEQVRRGAPKPIQIPGHVSAA